MNYQKIQITHICNENCIFCYDKWEDKYWKHSQYDISRKSVFESISSLYKDGEENVIVFTWWDPTHDSNIIEYVRFAKEIGYSWIEVITNWTKFANSEFTYSILEAWLTWVNISIHGHTSHLHNRLTGNPQAFQNLLLWIINLRKLSPQFNISIYIVLNSLNIKYIDFIIKFFSKFWIRTYYLLQLIPFWNAVKNRYIFIRDKKLLYFSIKNILRKYIWTNVTINISHLVHPNYLEGSETHIPNVENILFDIEKNLWMDWQDVFTSKNLVRCNEWELCELCYLHSFCNNLEDYFCSSLLKDSAKKDFIYLEDNLLTLPKQGLLEKIKKMSVNNTIVNIPTCLSHIPSFYDNFSSYSNFHRIEKNFNNFLHYFSEEAYFVKSLRCQLCSHNGSCKWVNLKIVRRYGFDLLTPM